MQVDHTPMAVRSGNEARRAAASTDARADAALLARIAAGDRRAFESLYRVYHARLTRFLFNMTRRPSLVEEVLHDTLFFVWEHPERFNGASRLSTWIFAIAYRKALSALRRQDAPMEDKGAEDRPSDEAGPERLLGERQTSAALQSAMGELSADHRAVVDLAYFHDMAYQEISEVMACPIDTVKTRMFHARRRLKQSLGGRLADWL
jgi:RNA polymerase sigma-70 factor (ECF subfamily)